MHSESEIEYGAANVLATSSCTFTTSLFLMLEWLTVIYFLYCCYNICLSLPVAGHLVEELTWLLCSRKQLSRAALHLLLVPQLRGLSLEKCPGLVTSALCPHIAARCQVRWKAVSVSLSSLGRLYILYFISKNWKCS